MEGRGEWSSDTMEEKIRIVICDQIEKMYHKINIYTIMEWLDLPKKETEERCKKIGWMIEEDGKMIRVGKGEGSGSSKIEGVGAGIEGIGKKEKRNEVLSEEQLSKLLALIQAS